MHLEELEWFVVLAETEHVTEAAAELGVSQPTFSRALTRIEQKAGVPLFDRVGRRLRLVARRAAEQIQCLKASYNPTAPKPTATASSTTSEKSAGADDADEITAMLQEPAPTEEDQLLVEMTGTVANANSQTGSIAD